MSDQPRQAAAVWLRGVTGMNRDTQGVTGPAYRSAAITTELKESPDLQVAAAESDQKEARALTLAVKDMTGAMRHLMANKTSNGDGTKPPGGKAAPRDADVSEAVRMVRPERGCCGAGKTLPMYDPGQLFLKTLFSWHGTVLPLTVAKPSYWFIVGLHGLALAWDKFEWFDMYVQNPIEREDIEPRRFYTVDDTEGSMWVDAALLSPPATLYIFFVVFYASQCYARYFLCYDHTIGIGATTMCWVGLVKLHFPDVGQAAQWNMVRFVLAASHVHYYMLAGSENCVSEYEWKTLLERQLLTEEEKEVVTGYQGMKQFLLITWALQEVKAALYVTDADATAPGKGGTFRTFQTVGFELRGHCGQLVNLLKQPVPWAYFHLLNMLQFFVLGLLAIGIVGYAYWWITLLVHAVITLILLGLKDLGSAMADPFGDDAIDFNVHDFLTTSYLDAVSHLAVHRKPLGTRMPRNLGYPVIAQ